MEAKFYEPKYKDGKILALADVVVCEGVTVKGFRIVDGDKGVFAAVPSRPVQVEGQTRYFNQVVFSKPEKKEEFQQELLEAYRSWVKSRAASRETAS